MGQVGIDWSQFEDAEEMLDALIKDMEHKEVDEESWPATQSFWLEFLRTIKIEVQDDTEERSVDEMKEQMKNALQDAAKSAKNKDSKTTEGGSSD